jgi:preprotein translocase subunit SecE
MSQKQQEQKGSRVLEILTTEYPIDRILLVVMGMIVTVVGYYLVTNDPFLSITNTTSWYTKWIFGSDLGILIFSIFILLMGVAALGIGLWPYFQPSIKEMKRVTWPNIPTIRNHSARVFGFILFLVVVFVVYENALGPLFDWLKSLGN